ncbi:MAG: hypothetical protein LBI10_05480, partial [Deltaproteobacteria bacterium]|nr:hypothetical protein [Deltaproteobacteria bacterium]
MSLKIIGLCMVVIGFLAVPLWAQTPSPQDAAQWRRAEYLLQKGQGEEAYPIYAELLSKFPGHNALLLGRARSAA